MKRNIIYRAILLLSVSGVVITGCKKDDFAINVNPNDITASTVDYKAVLPASLTATASIEAGGTWTVLRKWMGFWARSGSYQGDTGEETYSFTNDFNSAIWFNNYSNATNYDFVQKKANAAGAGFYEAIARIMKAKNFQMLVDTYGNIPYTEALLAAGNRKPKYDDDEAIYKDLFRQLDTAITLLKDPVLSGTDNNPAIAINDLVFKGNKTSWRKFANTLKLRMIIHTGNTKFTAGVATNTWVSSIDQKAEMAIITADGSGFLGSGESATINPGYNDTKPNPFYGTYVKTSTGSQPGTGDATKANKYVIGYFAYDGDPRVDKLFTRPGGDATKAHRGITYGQVAGFNTADNGVNLSGIEAPGLVQQGAASNAWIFTAVESLFLQAEAIQRGLYPGDATAMYTAAVRESFTRLGLTVAQADAYLSGNAGYADVDLAAKKGAAPSNNNDGGMYTILSQKWFALTILATQEVWTDYRRSDIVYGAGVDYDAGPPISIFSANNKTHIPIRFFYPQEEYNLNATNALGEGAVINVITAGGTAGKNRIFWDKND